MIQRGETDGVFQIESAGMKKMFMGMNSVDFNDLIAGVALYRPGPMEKIPSYVARRNGQEEIPSVSADYDAITKVTHGFLVYQEQVMQIAQRMGGYSMGQADTFRKAVGKKKKEILEPALEELHQRMLNEGIDVAIADKVCEDIRPFSGYGFNKSHAAAYAYICYQTAYLKANYPLEYMTALLQVFYEDEDKVVKYIKVAKEMGFNILPPDINFSQKGFSIDGGNGILFGFGAMKGLGEAAVNAILEERKERMIPVICDNDGLETIISEEEAKALEGTDVVVGTVPGGGLFTSVENLMERIPKCSLNKKNLEALCYGGAFDNFLAGTTNNRFDFMAHILMVRGSEPDEELQEAIKNYSDRLKFEKERKILGTYVSGHALSRLATPIDWEGLDDATQFTMVSLVEAKIILTKRGQNMAFLKVDTLEGERNLTLFPQKFDEVKEALVPGMILKVGIKGKMNWQRNQKDYIVTTITAPKKINKSIWKNIEMKKKVEGVA